MVTVVVPVYNAEKYLDECLESILQQSYSDFELLLFIGKCTDSSRKICEKYQSSDSRIKIYDQIKVGPGGARNQGIDMASGEYIYFCDADDYLAKDCLKTYVNIAESGNYDIVESNAISLTQSGCCWTQHSFGCSFWAINIGHDSVERCASPAVWKFFSRVDLWRSNNLRFADFLPAMDDLATYSLLFKTAKKPCYILDELYYYRIMPGSLSRSPEKLRSRFQNIFKICSFLSTEFKKRNMFNESRLTLASQMEHHGKLTLQLIPDLTADEYNAFSGSLSQTIKESFNVSTSTFDCGAISLGSNLVHTLADRISLSPTKSSVHFKDTVIGSIDNEVLKNISGHIKSCRANVAIIDLINEVQNLNNIDDFESHLRDWKDKLKNLINVISNSMTNPAKIIFIENYYCLLDYSGAEIQPFVNHDDLEFFNEVLGLYYAAAKETVAEGIFLPSAPAQIMFSEKGIPTDYNSCVVIYHFCNAVDALR